MSATLSSAARNAEEMNKLPPRVKKIAEKAAAHEFLLDMRLDRALAEAASQYHAKAAKIRTAGEAVLLQDQAKLLRADREKVRQLEKRIGVDTGAEDDVGDIILTDDYRVEYPTRGSPPTSGLAKGLLAGLLGALVIGGPLATYALLKDRPVSGEDTDSAYVISLGKEPVE